MDDDYFDVDFEFGANSDDEKNIKAIYVKRKAYRDISKELLNPENVLSTDNIRNSILSGLKDEPRYQMLLDSNKNKKIDMGYLLGKKQFLATKEGSTLEESERKIKERYHELYFQMLKEDKL